MAISYLDFIIENEKFENQTAIIAAQEIEEEKYWPLYLGNLWLFGHSTP